MANFEQFILLMSEVAPILDPLMIDVSAGPKCCLVVMEADLGVLIQLDEKRNRLFLSTELGAPPPCDLKQFYETLLYVNYHWEKTGGARLALNRPGGDVVLVSETAADGQEATQFCAILTSFAATAKASRKIVQNPAAAQDAGAAPDFVPGIRI